MHGIVCSGCGMEVTPELTKLSGWEEVIQQAGDDTNGYTPLSGSTAEITLGCSCGHTTIEYDSGEIRAWDVPDGWIFDSEEVESSL